MSERVTIGLFAAAAVAGLLSLSVGPAHLPGAAILSALLGKGDPATQLVVWQLRLPRTVLALAIGATLGLAGAATQGYARNPLASPDVLGIPAFASLGAVAAIYFGYGGPLSIAVPITAIVSAFGGTALLFLLAGRESGPLLFLLAGLV